MNQQTEIDRDAIKAMLEKWVRIARNKGYAAQRETDPKGKLMLENGMMCYFNCICELSRALGVSVLPPSATPEADQTQPPPSA